MMFERLKIALSRKLATWLIAWNWRGRKAANLEIADEQLAVEGGRIGVRIYTPRGQGPFPVVLFFHGGGWVACNLETHDAVCRDLCVQARHLIVSVDYRLAPEFPFPTGLMDCLAALAWLQQQAPRLQGDADRITLCGDSAGGNLAAVVAQQARTRHPGLIKGQVLIYPVTDHPSGGWPSYAQYGGSNHRLTTAGMTWLWQLYLRNSTLVKPGECRHDLATPLLVKDLSGLPRTLVLLAEFDGLRDEGFAYAQRLTESGTAVQHKLYARQEHGFLGFQPTSAHHEAIADIANWLNAAAR